ncbi:MAG: hypothetical protein Q9162_006528 [Coniocarpon cinnabarinum]
MSDAATVEDVVKVLLYQLYLKARRPLDAYNDLQQASGHSSELGISQLLSVLERTITQFERIYIVLEGLDECSDTQNERLSQLLRLIESSGAALLTTSLSPPNLPVGFPLFDAIDITELRLDLQNFVTDSVALLFQDQDEMLQSRIIKSVVQQARGRFILAEAALERLRQAVDDRHTHQGLQCPPPMVKSYHNTALEKASETSGRAHGKAVICFELMLCSARLLSREELTHAVDIGISFHNEDRTRPIKDEIGEIFEVYGDLLVTDEPTSAVTFTSVLAREMVREWLDDHSNRPPNDTMINVCLRLLSSCILENGKCNNQKRLAQRLADYPFLSYAVQYWGYHHRQSISTFQDSESSATFATLLKDHKHVEAIGQLAFVLDSQSPSKLDQYTLRSSALDIMAWAGVTVEQRHWEEFTAFRQPRKFDGRDQTPLHVASRRGHAQFVTKFLQSGFSGETGAEMINEKDESKRTACHYAVLERHANIVQILLSYQCDVRILDCNNKTPFQYAVENGDSDTMEKFLASKSLSQHELDLALELAIKCGHVSLVYLLTQHSVSVTDDSLFLAIEGRSEAAFKVLLAKGADIDTRNDHGQTLLQAALKSKATKTVTLLLENGAEVNVVDNEGRSPLVEAIDAGDSFSVDLIVQGGASIHCTDNHQRQPIHVAASVKNVEVLEELLRRGASANCLDDRGRSHLFVAIQSGDESCAKTLLEHGSLIGQVDNAGQRPLSLTVAARNETLTRLLLEHDARPFGSNIADEVKSRVLAYAIGLGDQRMIDLLVEFGVAHIGGHRVQSLKKGHKERALRLTPSADPTEPAAYTVGWMCCLDSEWEAARACFDEEHETPIPIPTDDDNSYMFGTISGLHVVVVRPLPDLYGKVSWSSAAADMRRSFTSVKVTFLVCPATTSLSKENDIHSGDVIACGPSLDRRSSGLDKLYSHMQATYGLRDKIASVLPRIVQMSINLLQPEETSNIGSLSEDIGAILSRHPELETQHRQQARTHEVTATADDEVEDVTRRLSTTALAEPSIHFGLVTSFKEPAREMNVNDESKKEHAKLHIQSGAAEAMEDQQCILVCGVCDYEGSDTVSNWDDYNVLAGAVCVRKIISKGIAN